MDKVTILFAFFAALGVATERVTEVIKGFVPWLASEQKGTAEELRKAVIHILAFVIGSVLAWQTYGQLPASWGVPAGGFATYFLFGAMASGGSGLWNSVLDIVREVNKQKQILTDKLKAG